MTNGRLSLAIGLVLPAACAAAVQAAGNETHKKFPKFAAVKAAAQKAIAARKGYRSGDILTREDAAKALDAVEKTGWKIADREKIAGSFLAEEDYLIRELRTLAGTRFMRRISGTPQTYDRLDRLRGLKLGNRRIRELIDSPGGHTLILYMAQTQGGRNLGVYLGNVSGGKNFNKPTGRFYTERQLLERLKLSYDAAVKQRKSGKMTKTQSRGL